MLKQLERYFEFTHLGTNWRTEILAGVTTFLTMAYIVVVNPSILAAAGIEMFGWRPLPPAPMTVTETEGSSDRRAATRNAKRAWSASMPPAVMTMFWFFIA